MLTTIRRLVLPPTFNTDEKNRQAHLLHFLLLPILIFLLGLIVVLLFSKGKENQNSILYFTFLFGASTSLFLLTHRGKVHLASMIFVSFSFVVNLISAVFFGGASGLGFSAFFITILLAGLLLGLNTALITAVCSLIAILSIAYLENIGLLAPVILVDDPQIRLYVQIALFGLITFVLYLALDDLKKANEKAREKEHALRDIVNETTSALIPGLDLDKVLNTILTLLYRVIPYDSVAIFLAEETKLRVMAGRGFENPHEIIGQEFAYESGVFDEISRTKRPLIVPDAQADPRFVIWASNTYIRGWLGIPLLVNDKLIGFLTIDSLQVGKYDEEDAELAQSFANQAVIAIENAQLFARVQNHAAILEEEVAKRTSDLHNMNQQLETEIAERKKAEEMLQAYTIELEKSNQELKSFAYIVSHDLQAPLRKIQAFGDRLTERYSQALDDRGLDYLARMQKSANHLSILINDLLNYSRITSVNEPFEYVDLNQVLGLVLSDLDAIIENEQAVIQVGALPTIFGNKTQMYQLFQNLIGNSLKFHEPDQPPEISIKAEKIRDHSTALHKLSVADNGIGFDEKYLDRIFNIFQRLHDNNTYSGTGVGLATCRKIVNQHEGQITATSQPGVGTTFIITLPVKQ